MITTCQFCSREIEQEGGLWVDPEATGDDITWRETCDENDTFAASHAPAETHPQHLSAEYWAKCTEIRGYLLTVLDGLVLGVGIREPDSETDPELMLFLAPTGAAGGVILYEWESARFIVLDRPNYSMADYYAVIHSEGRPALQVSALLRGAVELLDIIE